MYTTVRSQWLDQLEQIGRLLIPSSEHRSRFERIWSAADSVTQETFQATAEVMLGGDAPWYGKLKNYGPRSIGIHFSMEPFELHRARSRQVAGWVQLQANAVHLWLRSGTNVPGVLAYTEKNSQHTPHPVVVLFTQPFHSKQAPALLIDSASQA